MKKSLKKQLKKWNIGDYVRQFSIVTGGVLLTLWLTAKIADSAKQRELRPANLPRQVETDFLCPFRPLQFRSLQLPFCARFHRTGVLRLRRGTRHGIPT